MGPCLPDLAGGEEKKQLQEKGPLALEVARAALFLPWLIIVSPLRGFIAPNPGILQ